MDDVIVVGAGPAGNNTALGLATRGHAVTVIDWRHDIGDKLCTGLVGRECIRRFPIDPEHVLREPRSAMVMAPGAPGVLFEANTSPACIVDRVAYVASFAHRAQDAGAVYLLGQRVQQIIPQRHGVTVVTDRGTRQARALVLASGFGSPLARQAGFGSVTDYVTGVQAVVSTNGIEDVEVHLGHDVAPGFFSWLVPTRRDTALVGLLSRRKAQDHLARFVECLQQKGKIGAAISEAKSWGIPLRPLKRTYRDRILVVGDAAGQVKPTTGGGIYYSLLVSEIAAQVMSEALNGDDLSASGLRNYQTRWHDLLGHELNVGYSARRLYEFLSDKQIGSLVQQAGANGINGELTGASDVSFDWHSRMIGNVLGHPVLGAALKMINPVLARLARPTEPETSGPVTGPVNGQVNGSNASGSPTKTQPH